MFINYFINHSFKFLCRSKVVAGFHSEEFFLCLSHSSNQVFKLDKFIHEFCKGFSLLITCACACAHAREEITT